MGPNRRSTAVAQIIARLSPLYALLLLSWVSLRSFVGDRWWWLFFLNSVSPYCFLPLIVLLPAAPIIRRRGSYLALGVSLAIGLVLYGDLLLPPAASDVEGPRLTVSTYNLLSTNGEAQEMIENVLSIGSDVFLFQELNPSAASAIASQLNELYPYQELAPQRNMSGLGVISRYPLADTGKTLGGSWLGRPQIINLDLQGNRITLANMHAIPTDKYRPRAIKHTIDVRQRLIRTLVEFAETESGPLLVAGDFNLTDQHGAYGDITGVLQDAWRGAGWGLGHTFPSGIPPDRPLLRLGGLPFPRWLFRIDYVFHSGHWRAVSAKTGPWDGVSDHRPLTVELRLETAPST